MATPTEVIWTAQAETALDRVHRWIAANAPTTADRYCDGLFAATNSLSRHPARGHPLHEVRLHPDENPYREIHFKRHRIIYSIIAHRVFILTVIHHLQLLDLKALRKP
jgi:plasmid stabilization system protein ParE